MIDDAIGQSGFGFLADMVPDTVSIRDRFLVPPFTLLDTRAGYWRERKAEWLALGIESEIGRDAKAYSCNDGQQKKYDYLPDIATGTSIFDPVLCELLYRWFCPAGGHVLDPFAGGSVRGIVAVKLGLKYTGIDLSERQVEANREQAQTILGDESARWIVGDSRNIEELTTEQYDMVFTCPPYYDLEVYSDDAADLSTAPSYGDFLAAYMLIVAKSILRLKPNRFACFVVGNIRDKQGFYYDLVGDTVNAFAACDIGLYNEAILLNSVGSLPIRITKQFNSGRKMGKCHQNILIFYKGDPKRIKEEFGGDVVME